jgi:hypothetical protein
MTRVERPARADLLHAAEHDGERYSESERRRSERSAVVLHGAVGDDLGHNRPHWQNLGHLRLGIRDGSGPDCSHARR